MSNSSLFSQFANILSFTRFRGQMKNVSNIIAWTSVDEQIHANAGIFLINKLIEEGHEIDSEHIKEVVLSYMNYEENLLNWIYEYGDLEFFNKNDMLNFMKFRLDESLVQIGVGKVFDVTSSEYEPMKWFEEEVFSNSLDDFFCRRPVDYTKHDKPITGNDLF
jgi:ribonucleoside-diphosphate reductase beta chain